MATGKAYFIHSPDLDRHSYPAECPFNSQRAGMTRRILASMGLLSGDDRAECPPQAASPDMLERFHTRRYLGLLQKAARGHLDVEGLSVGLGSPECPVFAGMYDLAVLVAGATVTAAERILCGDARSAFNPSGGLHHAGPELAAGFCYINDLVLGCLKLTDARKRVLFLDVDVHHGDGVQNAFYSRSDVMTMSFHESGRTLFPGTGFEDEIGVGDGKGYSVNVPLPVGTYDEAYLWAFDEVALPLIGAYRPDVIVLAAGMDCLSGDPLAHLCLTNNAYADVLNRVIGFGVPLLMTGGGGYNARNAARGWALLWSILCGDAAREDLSLGMGGVMLESTDWKGGLRDRAHPPSGEQRKSVESALRATVEKVKANVFALHGL